MKIAYFDPDGRLLLLAALIEGSVMGPPEGAAHQAEVPDAAGPNAIYFDVAAGEVAQKTPFPVAVSRNLISGVPEGTTAFFVDDSEIVHDGEIEFVANTEETVEVMLMHPRHLTQIVEVETGP